ncbi:hypothetical protein Tco_1577309 [Tanacetum coccineum]
MLTGNLLSSSKNADQDGEETGGSLFKNASRCFRIEQSTGETFGSGLDYATEFEQQEIGHLRASLLAEASCPLSLVS